MNGISLNKKPSRNELGPDEILCDHCTAKCCRYFALPIETPTTRRDFDFIRWYLLHDRASVFAENDDWFLLVHTTCQHLQSDNRCGIYESRPEICREYTTDECEYDDRWTYDKYFETPEQISEYVDAIFVVRKGESIRSPKPLLLPIL